MKTKIEYYEILWYSPYFFMLADSNHEQIATWSLDRPKLNMRYLPLILVSTFESYEKV